MTDPYEYPNGPEDGSNAEILEEYLDSVINGVQLFDVPPESFVPLKADREELLRFGFPGNILTGEFPQQDAFWKRMLSEPLTFKPPAFGFTNPIDAPEQPATRHLQRSLFFASRNQSSGNWSGSYIKPRDGEVLTEIYGTWRVPTLSLPPDAVAGREYRYSAWIGLDGQRRYHHSSLPQIGIAQTVTRDGSGGTTVSNVEAWWQWWVRDIFPLPPLILPLAINVGDIIMSSIIVEPDRRGVKFFIKNQTTGEFVTPFIRFAPLHPSGPPLRVSGATGEWITERPSIWPTAVEYGFPDYGDIPYADCLAITESMHSGNRTERDLAGARLIDLKERRFDPERTYTLSVTNAVDRDQFETVYK